MAPRGRLWPWLGFHAFTAKGDPVFLDAGSLARVVLILFCPRRYCHCNHKPSLLTPGTSFLNPEDRGGTGEQGAGSKEGRIEEGATTPNYPAHGRQRLGESFSSAISCSSTFLILSGSVCPTRGPLSRDPRGPILGLVASANSA